MDVGRVWVTTSMGILCCDGRIFSKKIIKVIFYKNKFKIRKEEKQ